VVLDSSTVELPIGPTSGKIGRIGSYLQFQEICKKEPYMPFNYAKTDNLYVQLTFPFHVLLPTMLS